MKGSSIALTIGCLAIGLVGCSSPSTVTPTVDPSASGQATYAVYGSLEELAQQTTVAFEGTVIDIQVELVLTDGGPPVPEPTYTPSPTDSPSDGPSDSPTGSAGPTGLASASSTPVPERAVYTIYTMRIDNCLKGCQGYGGSLQLTDLGGHINGISYNTPYSLDLERDKAYILFLKVDSSGTLVLVNPSQSAYSSPAEQGAFQSLYDENQLKLTPDALRKLFS